MYSMKANYIQLLNYLRLVGVTDYFDGLIVAFDYHVVDSDFVQDNNLNNSPMRSYQIHHPVDQMHMH